MVGPGRIQAAGSDLDFFVISLIKIISKSSGFQMVILG